MFDSDDGSHRIPAAHHEWRPLLRHDRERMGRSHPSLHQVVDGAAGVHRRQVFLRGITTGCRHHVVAVDRSPVVVDSPDSVDLLLYGLHHGHAAQAVDRARTTRLPSGTGPAGHDGR